MKLTPMMQQYYDIKEKYPEHILFFRMGDFYEMFDEDADKASQILNIVLTKRAKTSMCGIPYHSYKPYLKKMIDAGVKVAICEQLEDPKKAKGIVKRGVTEIITPGTVTSEEFLETSSNYILAVYKKNNIAWADISTGDFFVCSSENENEIIDQINRVNPQEIIMQQKDKFLDDEGNDHQSFHYEKVTWLSDDYINSRQANPIFTKYYDIFSSKSFGLDKNLTTVSSFLIQYFIDNEIKNFEHLKPVKKIELKSNLIIDEQTRKNLEIFEPLFNGEKNVTLYKVLNKTKTPIGNRSLHERLKYPYRNEEKIKSNISLVEYFYDNKELNSLIRDHLKDVKDIERLFVKILMNKATPIDMLTIASSIKAVKKIENILIAKDVDLIKVDTKIEEYQKNIQKTINENASTNIDKGNVIKKGVDKDFDKLLYVEENSQTMLIDYQEKVKKETGINNLRIKFNKVFGYFFEVSKGNLDKVPDYFMRKQTLTNSERYTTEHLVNLETDILSAEDKRVAKEKELYNALVESGKEFNREIQILSEQIGNLDILTNFAYLAYKNNWYKPSIGNHNKLEILEGRHPSVETSLKKEFIPNDLNMSEKSYFHLITGPNMSGKSTFLRQNAIIIIMAHLGSFVPATKAHIPIFDQIFSRIGASDNIASGQSTFLIEMSETANILNNATEDSFVILDEVGRGTSTFDGMSLAHSISEYIIRMIKCKTLFATHYHELTLLSSFPGVKNYRTTVKEWNNKIIFLKKVEEGSADKSYGIYVAKLAGIPPKVISDAKELLKTLEKNEINFQASQRKSQAIENEDDKNFLFDSKEFVKDSVIEKLKSIDINNITPMKALNHLNEILEELNKNDL